MFKLKLRFFFLFAFFLAVSCAMDDEKTDGGGNNGGTSNNVRYTDFLIDISGFSVPRTEHNYYFEDAGDLIKNNSETVPSEELISIENDTVKLFPSDTAFYDGVRNCISNTYCHAYNIVNSLFNPKLKQETWMDFKRAYFGTYTSSLDSRIKQWEVLEKQEYGGTEYDYSLKIFDMPEGGGSETKNIAVEFFYDGDFQDGVIIFSPSDYDKVGFPENVYGHGLRYKLSFSKDGDSLVNVLSVTNISGNRNNVYHISNVYLKFTEYPADKCVKFQALADLPNLWFDSPSNAGYCICTAGTTDNGNRCTVFYTGLVRNAAGNTSASELITDNASGRVLGSLYPEWKKLFVIESDTLQPSLEYDGNLETDTVSGALFENPACFSSENYQGSGPSALGNRSLYQKADRNTLQLLNRRFDLSPYQNSINEIAW